MARVFGAGSVLLPTPPLFFFSLVSSEYWGRFVTLLWEGGGCLCLCIRGLDSTTAYYFSCTHTIAGRIVTSQAPYLGQKHCTAFTSFTTATCSQSMRACARARARAGVQPSPLQTTSPSIYQWKYQYGHSSEIIFDDSCLPSGTPVAKNSDPCIPMFHLIYIIVPSSVSRLCREPS